MGWGPVLESVHQEPELLLCLLLSEAKHGEHLLLQVAVMDTNRSAADLHAVDYQVVSVCAYGCGVTVEQGDILRFGGGEGVVLREEAVQLFVLLQEGEVHHPEAAVVVFVAQAQT